MAAASALLALTTATGPQANLITNGSFETGDLTGWSLTGNTGFTSVQANGSTIFSAQDGNFFLYAGPVGSDGVLSQTFSDTLGRALLVSAELAGDGTAPSDFSIMFNATNLITINPVPAQGYVDYTFTVVGTGSDTLSLDFRDDPAFDAIDNLCMRSECEKRGTRSTSRRRERSTLGADRSRSGCSI